MDNDCQMQKNNSGNPVSSAGFTLLELLIYIVIASLVMSAGIMLFKSSATQRNTLAGSAEIRRASFMASHVLSQQFAQIGYRQVDKLLVSGRAIPLAPKESAFPAVPNEWSAGQVVKGTDTTLVFRFSGASRDDGSADETIFDCHGTPVAAETIRETQLTFQDNQLHCTTAGQTSILLGINDSVDVERVIFELGVDDNSDGAIDRQIPSSGASSADLINTRQVTARVLLASDDHVAADVQPYHFDNQKLTPTDRKLRVESEITVALRN